MEIAPRLRSLGLAGLLHRGLRLRFRLGLGLALGRGCGLFLRGGTGARGLGLRLRRGFGHGVGRYPGRGRSGPHLFLGGARNGLGRHLLHLLRRERLVRGGRWRRDRLVTLCHHFALVHPALDADHPVSGFRLRKSVVDVGAQRVERHAPMILIPCAPRRMAFCMARFMARRNMMRFSSCCVIESAMSCASTSGLRISSIFTCTICTPRSLRRSDLSISMSSPFLPMTTPGRALWIVMRASLAGRSITTLPTEAWASLFFK